MSNETLMGYELHYGPCSFGRELRRVRLALITAVLVGIACGGSGVSGTQAGSPGDQSTRAEGSAEALPVEQSDVSRRKEIVVEIIPDSPLITLRSTSDVINDAGLIDGHLSIRDSCVVWIPDVGGRGATLIWPEGMASYDSQTGMVSWGPDPVAGAKLQDMERVDLGGLPVPGIAADVIGESADCPSDAFLVQTVTRP